jgi:DNA-binding protein HU-beta
LIEELSRKTLLPKKNMERFVQEFLFLITETLRQNGRVQILHFGTFFVQERKGRHVKNPRTKKEVFIPSRKVPAFKPAKMFSQRF